MLSLQLAGAEQSASCFCDSRCGTYREHKVSDAKDLDRESLQETSRTGDSARVCPSVADLQDGGCGVLVTGLWRGGQDGAVGVPLLQAVPHQLRNLQHPAPGRPRRVSWHVPACCAACLKRLWASHCTIHTYTVPSRGLLWCQGCTIECHAATGAYS